MQLLTPRLGPGDDEAVTESQLVGLFVQAIESNKKIYADEMLIVTGGSSIIPCWTGAEKGMYQLSSSRICLKKLLYDVDLEDVKRLTMIFNVFFLSLILNKACWKWFQIFFINIIFFK